MSENNPLIQPQIRVLIISDRLIDQAKKLSDYFCSVGIHVIGLVETEEQALKLADQAIDFLIIAGYLRNEESYDIIKEYRNRRKIFYTVHWAMLDSLISGLCSRYEIPLRFERTLPISEFTAFLQQHRPIQSDFHYEELEAKDNHETVSKKPHTLSQKPKSLSRKIVMR